MVRPHLLRWPQQLNMTTKDLLPVKMQMKVANGSKLHLLGGVILRLTNQQRHITIGQTVFVTREATKFYLNRETCELLELYLPTFTDTVAELTTDTAETSSTTPTQDTTPAAACGCPHRAQPPPRPTAPPVSPTPENRQQLEEHLLDLYSASSFNTCKHQTLPLMTGPPLCLKIDPLAAPLVQLIMHEELEKGEGFYRRT